MVILFFRCYGLLVFKIVFRIMLCGSAKTTERADYGPLVNRAARLMGAAFGGHVPQMPSSGDERWKHEDVIILKI